MWLLIHSDCEFYREMLKDYNIITKDFKYMQNFGKDKDHFRFRGEKHLAKETLDR